MCFAITLLESNKIIAQTKVIMFNKKNNSLPNFLHVFLGIWLQVVWGGAVHHPGLRGRRRRVKNRRGQATWCVDTVPTHHYAICHLTHAPVPSCPFNRGRAAMSPSPRARSPRSHRLGVCALALKTEGDSQGGKGSGQTWCVRGGVVSW